VDCRDSKPEPPNPFVFLSTFLFVTQSTLFDREPHQKPSPPPFYIRCVFSLQNCDFPSSFTFFLARIFFACFFPIRHPAYLPVVAFGAVSVQPPLFELPCLIPFQICFSPPFFTSEPVLLSCRCLPGLIRRACLNGNPIFPSCPASFIFRKCKENKGPPWGVQPSVPTGAFPLAPFFFPSFGRLASPRRMKFQVPSDP